MVAQQGLSVKASLLHVCHPSVPGPKGPQTLRGAFCLLNLVSCRGATGSGLVPCPRGLRHPGVGRGLRAPAASRGAGLLQARLQGLHSHCSAPQQDTQLPGLLGWAGAAGHPQTKRFESSWADRGGRLRRLSLGKSPGMWFLPPGMGRPSATGGRGQPGGILQKEETRPGQACVACLASPHTWSCRR